MQPMKRSRWSVVMGLTTLSCTPFASGQGSESGSLAESSGTSTGVGPTTAATDPTTAPDTTTGGASVDDDTTTTATTTTAATTTEPTTAASSGSGDSGGPESFFRREITIHGDQVPGDEQLLDFTVLIRYDGDAGLAHVGSGGHVLDATGADLVFRDESLQPLARELVGYRSNTGALVAWVRVPAVAGDADTTIYLDYGAPSLVDLSPTGAWNDDYVGAWHFEDDVVDGGPILDSSPTGSHGTAMSMDAANSVGGQVGQGVSFTQPDAAVAIGGGALDFPGPVTFEGWARMDGPLAFEGYQRLFHKGGTNEGPLFMWVGDLTVGLGNITFLINYTDFDTYGLWHFTTISGFAYGQWHHYAGVVGGPGDDTALFVDGVRISSGVYPEDIWTGYANLYFGNRDTSGPSRQWNGVIDEYRFSTVARSDAWIGASHANQLAPTTFSTMGPEQALP